MLKLFSILLLSVVFLSPALAGAQQAPSTTGGLQNSSSNTQSTDDLQTPTTIDQGTDPTLLESAPPSLGVVADPNQQTPSVSVGESQTKTEVSQQPSKKAFNAWVNILIFVSLGVILFIIYLIVSFYQKRSPEEESIVEETQAIDPKIQSIQAKKQVKTQSKNKPKSKNKKKKRAHR